METSLTILILAVVLILGYLVFFKKNIVEKIRQTLYPYPFSSGPGDKMFPHKEDTLGWVAYVLFSIALIIFLSQIFLMIKNLTYDLSHWVILIFIFFVLAGGIAQSFSSFKEKKPNQSLQSDAAKPRR